jgi:hypothetical protein
MVGPSVIVGRADAFGAAIKTTATLKSVKILFTLQPLSVFLQTVIDFSITSNADIYLLQPGGSCARTLHVVQEATLLVR